jgi:phage tail sheath protein FI
MPEYLAPGVYVEEVSYRAKSIEGVSTTTTGFVGPSRFGPIDLEPDIVTSLVEFERIYGDRQRLHFDSGLVMDNYLWHAARAFFEEGGKRLYISRIFRTLRIDESDEDESETYARPPARLADENPLLRDDLYKDGHARGWLPVAPANNTARDRSIQIRSRFPGSAGNLRVRVTVNLGQNILGGNSAKTTVGALAHNDVVWFGDATSPVSSPPGAGAFYLARYDKELKTWRLGRSADNSPDDWILNPADGRHAIDPARGDQIRVATLTVTVTSSDGGSLPSVWDGLSLDPGHERDGAPDSISSRFAQDPSNLTQARTLPIVISLGDDVRTGIDLLDVLLDTNTALEEALNNQKATDSERSVEVLLSGGNDGQRPGAAEYEGAENPQTNNKTGLVAFEDLEDISIVAAPGATFNYEASASDRDNSNAITNSLISHAERMKYRIAVLDSGNEQAISQVRAMRARLDSTHAAFYYPWVRVLDPVTRKEIHLPPSGFVAGIYARNDVNRAVYKAPANEVVNLAIGFEKLLNKGQQDVLNPEGINCFRYFEGRGFRLWGARTASSDPEWKYVNLRRYFAYLERSVDKGTQWAVFEPNGSQLWANVRRTIEDFLFNEWQMGALLGDKPEKAYFVRCDRSTMTQNDLDNGRLVCLIGVAPLRPAEFVIFRIGQWTADRKS